MPSTKERRDGMLDAKMAQGIHHSSAVETRTIRFRVLPKRNALKDPATTGTLIACASAWVAKRAWFADRKRSTPHAE